MASTDVMSTSAPGTVATLPPSEIPDVPVTIPPPETKKIIDHTAQSVLANPKLEGVLLIKKADDPKFAFLQTADVYNSYYRMRVKYPDGIPAHLIVATTASDDSMTATTQAAQQPTAESVTTGSPTNTAASVSAKTGVPPPPPPPPAPKKPSLFERMNAFVRSSTLPVPNPEDVENLPYPPPEDLRTVHTIKLPPVYYAHELDIIKLTALYVASNGRRFLAGLQNREMNNPQFDFLKVTHPHFPTFQQHVESYTQIIAKPHALIEEINQGLKDFSIVLEDLKLRGKYSLAEAIRKEQRERSGAAEEEDFVQTIDWHNFVVCETITFSSDEDPYLAEPKHTIEEIESALAMEQHLIQQAEQDAAEARSGAAGTATMVTSAGRSFTGGMVAVEGEDEDVIIRKPSDTEGTEAESTKPLSAEELMTPCPLCNTLVPVASLQEHITIELANPDWKKQKQLQAEQRQAAAATTLAQGGATSVATNLSRFIAKRSDTAALADAALAKTSQSWTQFLESMRQEENVYAPATTTAPPAALPTAARATAPAVVAGPAAAPIVSGPSVASVSSRSAAPISIRPAGPEGASAASSIAITPASTAPISSAVITTATDIGLGKPHSGGSRYGAELDSDLAKRGKTEPEAAVAAPAASAAAAATAGSNLVPEAEWLATHEPEAGATLSIKVPDMSDSKEGKEYLFDGRTFELPLTTLKETVGELKTRISFQLNNMPTNKMKASVDGVFLNKDNFSLAYYNVKPGSVLEVGLRVRGGKK